MSVYAPSRRQQRLDELTSARDRLNERIWSMIRTEGTPVPVRRRIVPTKPTPAELSDWRTQARLNQAELAHVIRETGGGLVHIQHPAPVN